MFEMDSQAAGDVEKVRDGVVHQRLDGRDVLRVGQGIPHRHWPVELVVEVVGSVGRQVWRGVRKGRRLGVYDGLWTPAFRHRDHVLNRLDGRARLSWRCGHVHFARDAAVVIVPAPNHHDDLAGLGVYGNETGVAVSYTHLRAHETRH